MNVTLLYFDDCPNWRAADRHLEALTKDRPQIMVTRQLVDSPQEAERLGFLGSPTILIDGVDAFPGGAVPDREIAERTANEPAPSGGLSCRIYGTPDGPAGSPTLEQLRSVLALD